MPRGAVVFARRQRAGRCGMILIEGRVDKEDTTYRVVG